MTEIHTASRNDANVSWTALIIQVDSSAFMSRSEAIFGIAENNDEMLNTSINSARQKSTSKTYLRRTGMSLGSVPWLVSTEEMMDGVLEELAIGVAIKLNLGGDREELIVRSK